MRFFLTGFMGCGKTFWGKKIAQEFALHFIDLDEYIENKEEENIAAIFSTHGEGYFRLIEHQALQEIIQTYTKCVVSCGGGTPCFHDNMYLMNKHDVTIYLKASVSYLFEKLQHEKTKRPLIAGLNETQMQQIIENTLTERQKYYDIATHIIDVEKADMIHFNKIFEQYV